MFKFLLGLDELPYEGGELTFAYNPPSELVLVALVLGALFAWFSYRKLRKGMPRGVFYLLTVLRTLTLWLVFLCFLGPQWTTPRELIQRRTMAVLVDESASMDRTDSNLSPEQISEFAYAAGFTNSPGATPSEEVAQKLFAMSRGQLVRSIFDNSKLALLDKLRENYDVKLFRFAKTVRSDDEKIDADHNQFTGLGSAIREAITRTSGESTAGILLISDGDQNYGPHPVPAARFAAGQGLQVFTVGIGGLLPAKDISVEPVDYREVVFKGDELAIATTIASTGYEGETVTVQLTLDGQKVKTANITFGKDGERLPVNFAVKVDNAGEYKLSLSVDEKTDEAVKTNNRRNFDIKVIEDKIRVLAIFGAPTWEYRFLKHALMRDPTMECTVLLQRSDGSLFYEGSHEQQKIPNDMESMLKFDVIILSDIAVAGFLSSDNIELIERLVGDAGGGLIYVAGEINGLSPLFGTKLENLLPIKAAALPISKNFTIPFRPALTVEGERHPALRLSADPEKNTKIWSELPQFYWYYPVLTVKPGAEVLLEHPVETAEGRPVPLMVQAYYGAGRVFFSGLDSTWRWRKEVDDRYFYRYWGQLIRHCGQERLLGGGKKLSISSDLPEYKPGSVVRILARALDRDHKPLELPSLECELTLPDGSTQRLSLSRDEARKAVYRGEATVLLPGTYKIRIVFENNTADTSFEVKYVSPEDTALTLNQDLLISIAGESGGEYLKPSDISNIHRLVASKPQKSLETVSENLLDAPLIFLLFILLLTLEWVIRRLVRLL